MAPLIFPLSVVYGSPSMTPGPVLSNASCLTGTTMEWQFGGGNVSPRSSITLLADSLASNVTYQLMVQMQNRWNPAQQAIGYLLVQVQDKQPQLIVIG